jgi:hypothetical protein
MKQQRIMMQTKTVSSLAPRWIVFVPTSMRHAKRYGRVAKSCTAMRFTRQLHKLHQVCFITSSAILTPNC